MQAPPPPPPQPQQPQQQQQQLKQPNRDTSGVLAARSSSG